MERDFLGVLAGAWLVLGAGLGAEEGTEKVRSLAELTAQCLDTVVVVYQQGRDAGTGATGSGFVIGEEGLIATNWHVINDRRRLTVELHDGTRHEVTEVHAWDRRLDLAVVKIDAQRKLPFLELGDPEGLKQGDSVAALGNPVGLKFSVVQGVVSAFRDDVGESPFPMIQLAIPVERGNSGGPLLDMKGRVQGVISLKSMVTENLGFAMPVSALRLLLEKPNPMPMERWATIGALNPRHWQPQQGAQWSQRAGMILGKGRGTGFGGRSLCLYEVERPGESYEVEVSVRMNDESGAAGLVFASDGGEVHYGFYPTGGRLRLTRFDGPDVMSWDILEQCDVPGYRMGDWNRLRVQVGEEGIVCYVNGEEVIRSGDTGLRGGQVGLCKFRHTEAEFRHFRVGAALGERGATGEELEAMRGEIRGYAEGNEEADWREVAALWQKDPEGARAAMREEREALEERLKRLERLSRDAHAVAVSQEIREVLGEGAVQGEADLFHAGLLVARVDNPDLDVEAYREMMARMAEELGEGLGADAGERERVEAVVRYMFEENGFHGSRLDYYEASNSYLNEVIDDREGIPITLSVIFMELAQRVGAETVRGVGMPGRFVVSYEPEPGKREILDIYEGGKVLTEREAMEMAGGFGGREGGGISLEPESEKGIVLRMLRNLTGLRKRQERPWEALPYLEMTLELDPEAVWARLDRMILRYQEGDKERARVDLRWLLQKEPPGLDLERLRQFMEEL